MQLLIFYRFVYSLTHCYRNNIMSSATSIQIHKNVSGYSERFNDILYIPPSSTSNRVTVYFGGDVQNFKDEMTEWNEWSLEDTARLLNNKFGNNHLLIIRPKRMMDNIYSVFSNFINCDKSGNPQFVPNNNALNHLNLLIKHFEPNPEKISVIGFSKGCVVVNQLIHEIASYQNKEFTDKIDDISLLDGGHGGGKETWITDKKVLEAFARNIDCDINVMVTPYQIHDTSRSWIGKEEEIFSSTMGKCYLNKDKKFIRRVFFENAPGSLLNHFKVLNFL